MSTIIPDRATFEEVGEILTQALLRVPPHELPSAVGWLARLQSMAQLRMMQVGQAETAKADTDLFTIPEVAQRLKVSEYRAYELARQGFLKSVRLGKSVRVTPSAVADYLAQQGA